MDYTHIETKIHNLAEILVNNKDHRLGLMLGEAGILLALFYYQRQYPEKIQKATLESRFEELLAKVPTTELNYSYSNGLAGIGWVISHLSTQKFIDVDPQESLGELDEFLVAILDDIQDTSHDILHGYLGLGFYFLERKHAKGIQKVAHKLLASKEEKNNEIFWIYKSPYSHHDMVNFGIAHGLPSILTFLSNVYALGYLQEELYAVIENVTKYIQSKKLTSESLHSYFPSTIDLDDLEREPKNSRLAWCYGDLGILISLVAANTILHKPSVDLDIEKALAATFLRKNFDYTAIKDACFCHGASGVSHIYRYLSSRVASKENCLIQSDFWLSETLNMADKGQGLAGYMTFYGSTGWENQLGILEGISGILLTLLSKVNPQLTAWEKVFLLK